MQLQRTQLKGVDSVAVSVSIVTALQQVDVFCVVFININQFCVLSNI